MKFALAFILCSAFSSLATQDNDDRTTLVLEQISLGFPKGSFAIKGLQRALVHEHFDMDASISIKEDNTEYHCQPRGEQIPSLPVYDECELLKPVPGTRAGADRNKSIRSIYEGSSSSGERLEYTNNPPGRLFFTVMPPFPGKKRRQAYLDEPLKMRFLYENAQGAYLTTDVVIWESELVKDAADSSGGNYPYATIEPYIYRMLPADTIELRKPI